MLSVAEGATATFLGSSEFTDNSIKIKQTGTVSCGVGCTTIGKGLSYVVKKGGAVHNKVRTWLGKRRGLGSVSLAVQCAFWGP